MVSPSLYAAGQSKCHTYHQGHSRSECVWDEQPLMLCGLICFDLMQLDGLWGQPIFLANSPCLCPHAPKLVPCRLQ